MACSAEFAIDDRRVVLTLVVQRCGHQQQATQAVLQRCFDGWDRLSNISEEREGGREEGLWGGRGLLMISIALVLNRRRRIPAMPERSDMPDYRRPKPGFISMSLAASHHPFVAPPNHGGGVSKIAARQTVVRRC